MGNFIFGGGSRSLNGGGLLVSPAVKSSSTPALSFVSQPQSKTVDGYALATFSCEVAGGTAPYSYQWKKNGTNVGTNSANLSLTAAAADKNASITVVVTDSAGSVIASTPVVLGVTSYIYQLDGLTQYFNLSESVAFAVGDRVEFDISFPTSAPISDAYVIDGSTRAYLFARSDGTLFYNSSRMLFTLDGSTIAPGSQMPLDGLTHKVVGTYQGAHTLRVVGISFPLSGGTTLSCKVKNLSMIRTSGNLAIPLNNKSQGANQLATVGSINATIVNYNAAVWTAL